jgi:transcriptional regulator with XRE-family HTH domain
MARLLAGVRVKQGFKLGIAEPLGQGQLSPAACSRFTVARTVDWTVADLADKAQVGISTVVRFEKGRGKPIAATIAAMQRCLEAGGVRFIENGVCYEPQDTNS